MARSKLVCPNCGSSKRHQIIWGLIADPLAHDQSRYVLGGCCIPPGAPKFQCDECDTQYGFSYDPFEIDERLRIDTPQDQ